MRTVSIMPGMGGARAGADGDQQRMFHIAEMSACDRRHLFESFIHHRLQLFGETSALLVVGRANISGDGETCGNVELDA